jgi:hypothetical protein
MNAENEPVAWILKENPQIEGEVIPLYTHPSEHDLGIAEAIGFDKGYKAATAKTLTANEIEDCYQLWQALSGDPEKLYQLFKIKEQEK